MQGKRVHVLGSNNPEIVYCSRLDQGWRNAWLETGGVRVWSYFSGPSEKGLHTHKCSEILTPGLKSSFGDLDRDSLHSH